MGGAFRSAERDIERAIVFLVTSIAQSGRNPKPVITHSLRTALTLEQYGCRRDVVVAGLLHDLIEDAAVRADDIAREFGPEVAALVEANTFDPSIEDRLAREIENFGRCRAYGKEALRVKAADILDNSAGFRPEYGEELFRYFVEKVRLFLDMSAPVIGNERLWSDLRAQYESMAAL